MQKPDPLFALKRLLAMLPDQDPTGRFKDMGDQWFDRDLNAAGPPYMDALMAPDATGGPMLGSPDVRPPLPAPRTPPQRWTPDATGGPSNPGLSQHPVFAQLAQLLRRPPSNAY